LQRMSETIHVKRSAGERVDADPLGQATTTMHPDHQAMNPKPACDTAWFKREMIHTHTHIYTYIYIYIYIYIYMYAGSIAGGKAGTTPELEVA